MPELEIDQRVDAAYIRLREGRAVRTEDLGEGRLVDYDASGVPLGVELLGVSRGVNTKGLPSRAEIERCLDEHHIRQFA